VGDHCTTQVRARNKNYDIRTTELKDIPTTSLSQLKKVEEKFKLGICVYEPSDDGT